MPAYFLKHHQIFNETIAQTNFCLFSVPVNANNAAFHKRADIQELLEQQGHKILGGVSKSMLKKSRLNFDKIEKCK